MTSWVLVLVAVMLVACMVGAASAAPSGSVHSIPGGYGGSGINVLCYDASGFSCAGAGYNGSSGQVSGLGWTTTQYWSYGSAGPSGTRHNCTTYAAYRLKQNGYGYPGWTGNATDWDSRAPAGIVDQSAAVGSIAQWNSGTGHVAYVEAVGAGWIETTSDSYGGGTDHLRIASSSPSWPDNFIHFKDVASPIPGDGTFVARQGSGEVYVMAGESPVYVSSWDAFGGPKAVQVLTPAQFDALRPEPLDGTYLFGTRTGRVFSVAGGAPVYLSNWNNVGGQAGKRIVGVDDWSIDNAGNPLSHLRSRPKDGAYLLGSPSGRVFVSVGGAPLYVSSWDHVGGQRAVAAVDDYSVDNPGNPASHLNAIPGNGYYLNAQPSGRVFMVAWGAPVYLSSWDHVGGQGGKPIVTVDDWAVDNAGHPASHLLSRPPDGSFLVGSPSGRVFRVAGGSPLYVSSWGLVGGSQPTAPVDDWALDNAGHPASHMLALPADGTLLRAQPSGARWKVSAGQRSLNDGPGGLVVDEAGMARIPLAPTGGGGGGTSGGGASSGGSGGGGGSSAGGGTAGGQQGVTVGGAMSTRRAAAAGLRASSAAAGRLLSVRARVGSRGLLIVRLVRRGTTRTIQVSRLKVRAGSHLVRWRRPRWVRPGGFAVIIFFKAASGAGAELRQAIRLG